jgi:hypothetical protein
MVDEENTQPETEEAVDPEEVYGMSDEDLQKAVEGSESDGTPPGDDSDSEGDETVKEKAETGDDEPQEETKEPDPEPEYVSKEEYQKILAERDGMAQAWTEFDRDPVGFVGRFPGLAQRMGLSQPGGQTPQTGGQVEFIPNVPRIYQGHESQKRQAEDAELQELNSTDVDAFEDRQAEIRWARQQRQEMYDIEMIKEKQTIDSELEVQCTQILNTFTNAYGKSDSNPDGLDTAAVGGVVDFAIQHNLAHDLEAAYLKMEKSGIIKKAQIQGAQKVTENLQKHTSTTQAGKGKGAPDTGAVRELTEKDLEKMSDEDIEKLGSDLGWS